MIYGCRTLAYRASYDIFVLNCSRAQLSSTCNTLQINTNSSGFLHIYTRKVLLPHSKHYNQHPIYFPLGNYTLISLQFMPISGEHTESYMIYTSEQRRSIQVFTYIHKFLHIYIYKVLLPHSKHYYQHPIYFPLCNTDFKSVRFMLHALLLDYIYTSEHIKNLRPTAL